MLADVAVKPGTLHRLGRAEHETTVSSARVRGSKLLLVYVSMRMCTHTTTASSNPKP